MVSRLIPALLGIWAAFSSLDFHIIVFHLSRSIFCILGCDMVGFHIVDYCLNFLDCCQRRLGCRVDRKNMLVEFSSRTVRVRALPIGIPYSRFENMAKAAPNMMRDKTYKTVLGVDRLDYTKGINKRIEAFELLFTKYPEHKEKVQLLQVAVPSRTDVVEYQNLKEEIDQLIGRVNGSFSTINWSPIHYIYGQVSQQDLAGYYRDSAVALVTPLRDGMNLVAKEFVACQVAEPGVLLLSPFAGAGETMREALQVNPYELEEMAEMIHRALTMDLDEKELRMKNLKNREKQNDVAQWMRLFFKAMGSHNVAEDDPVSNQMLPLTEDDFDGYLRNYIGEDSQLLLLLDYDGTLSPIVSRPELAKLPEETKKLLIRLNALPDVQIGIISGRNLNNVRELVGIDNITYAGNHGMEILHPDGSTFTKSIPEESKAKIPGLNEALEKEVCKHGAWIEHKGLILTWHYRAVPVDVRASLVKRATEIIKSYGFNAAGGHCVLEARPPVKWDKGRASIYILRTLYGVDWLERVRIIYAGDDKTDEDAMVALKGIAVTFRITSSKGERTAATRRLPSTDSVYTMLKWVERNMSSRPVKVRRNSGLLLKKNIEIEPVDAVSKS